VREKREREREKEKCYKNSKAVQNTNACSDSSNAIRLLFNILFNIFNSVGTALLKKRDQHLYNRYTSIDTHHIK